jgi:hypothetical protein
MSNLIPLTARTAIKREYWIRVISVWVLLVATGLMITALLLLPAYVLIESQKRAYATAYSEASVQSDEFATITDTIEETNTVARELLQQAEATRISSYLVVVDEALTEETRLMFFSFQQNENTIAIGGVADDRQALALLKSRLEATSQFERVELPISSLAGNEDISYTMQLILRESDI